MELQVLGAEKSREKGPSRSGTLNVDKHLNPKLRGFVNKPRSESLLMLNLNLIYVPFKNYTNKDSLMYWQEKIQD